YRAVTAPQPEKIDASCPYCEKKIDTFLIYTEMTLAHVMNLRVTLDYMLRNKKKVHVEEVAKKIGFSTMVTRGLMDLQERYLVMIKNLKYEGIYELIPPEVRLTWESLKDEYELNQDNFVYKKKKGFFRKK
ncbi:MAG: hypothetical protein ACFFBD_27995, partial [Candidatus Hodarchaeota archaeon]